jgi:hypothetical protein
VPFTGFNVDHVAIGPNGVFAVETKTRRKRKDRRTAHPAHIVKWNGRELTWPSGRTDADPVDQADRNAKAIAQFLAKATGEPVVCQPVLTLPGWWIESTGRGRVIVAPTKGLPRQLLKLGSPVLSPEQIQRIAYQLEQKCRPDPSGKG